MSHSRIEMKIYALFGGMEDHLQKDVTDMLLRWSSGDVEAKGRLTALVYDELRRMARNYMGRERKDHTLQTTALVHEAYLRLIDQRNVQWQNRAHFFAIAAQLMRQILVDYARMHTSVKRGGSALRLSIDQATFAARQDSEDVLALHEALENLAKIDSRKSQVIELRFFGGLTVEETAEVLKVAPITIMREWRLARAWLHRELKGAKNSVSDEEL
jgi:RNA polymerase sigma factor (TIGR02999 family)